MSIRIWTARAHRLFPAIVEAMGRHLAKDETAILLVPEQFTLAAERELMSRLKLEGMFQLDVLSPSRLYEHVLSAAGRDGREPLSDAGRRMAVSQALEKLGQAALLWQHHAAPRLCGKAVRADHRYEARRHDRRVA